MPSVEKITNWLLKIRQNLLQNMFQTFVAWAMVVGQLTKRSLPSSDTRGPQFESRHRQSFNCIMLTVNCTEKTKLTKKKVTNICSSFQYLIMLYAQAILFWLPSWHLEHKIRYHILQKYVTSICGLFQYLLNHALWVHQLDCYYYLRAIYKSTKHEHET